MKLLIYIPILLLISCSTFKQEGRLIKKVVGITYSNKPIPTPEEEKKAEVKKFKASLQHPLSIFMWIGLGVMLGSIALLVALGSPVVLRYCPYTAMAGGLTWLLTIALKVAIMNLWFFLIVLAVLPLGAYLALRTKGRGLDTLLRSWRRPV